MDDSERPADAQRASAGGQTELPRHQRLSHRDVLYGEEPELVPYRHLQDHRWQRKAGTLVAEGRLVVGRLIAGGRHRIRSLLLNPAAARALREGIGQLDPRVPVYLADPSTVQQLTGHDFHRGCLAIAERNVATRLDELLPVARRWLALDGVVDPDNVGSLFRSAAAFGVQAVLLGAGSADPLYRKAIRTSMAAVFEVPYVSLPRGGWLEAFGHLEARGVATIGLTARAPAIDIESFVARRPAPSAWALVVGAEGAGLSAAVEARVLERVRIPMARHVDSLNVSVAAAIALSRLATPRPNR